MQSGKSYLFQRESARIAKARNFVILSEAKNLSSMSSASKKQKRGEILRFAQNDNSNHHFRSLLSLGIA